MAILLNDELRRISQFYPELVRPDPHREAWNVRVDKTRWYQLSPEQYGQSWEAALGGFISTLCTCGHGDLFAGPSFEIDLRLKEGSCSATVRRGEKEYLAQHAYPLAAIVEAIAFIPARSHLSGSEYNPCVHP